MALIMLCTCPLMNATYPAVTKMPDLHGAHLLPFLTQVLTNLLMYCCPAL